MILTSNGDDVQLQPADEGCLVLLNGNAIGDPVTLQQGDEIQIGATRLVFTNAVLHAGMTIRRVGKMQRVTLVSIVLVLVLEALFILGFSLFRQDRASLQALREAEIVRANTQVDDTPVEEVEVAPPQLSFSDVAHSFEQDDQYIFDICQVRLQYRAQRGLTEVEREKIQIQSTFLEKVGTNEWTDPAGFLPAPNWTIHTDGSSDAKFTSTAFILLPQDPLSNSSETNLVYHSVILGGTYQVFYEGELQDEREFKVELPEDMARIEPGV